MDLSQLLGGEKILLGLEIIPLPLQKLNLAVEAVVARLEFLVG